MLLDVPLISTSYYDVYDAFNLPKKNVFIPINIYVMDRPK
jgi:hypothetical protein